MLTIKRTIIAALMTVGLVLGGLVLASQAMASDGVSLSQGCEGPSVKQVQQILNRRGYWAGIENGVFGKQTHLAVLEFQKDQGLSQTGIVGEQTKKALGINDNQTTPSRGGYTRSGIISMVATGYDGSWESNYPYYGAPSYMGLPLARGIVATDPNVIPMGTRLYIEGYGEAIAADQGNAIKGNRIDLYFDSREEAMNWGMKTVNVTVL
ncbi:MAG: 3D domain-containing protein [Syntrophomonadaceae bacterium]